MVATFAIRSNERNDIRALSAVKVGLTKNGLRIDASREIRVHRNGGLWQYEIPVEEHVTA